MDNELKNHGLWAASCPTSDDALSVFYFNGYCVGQSWNLALQGNLGLSILY